MVEHADEAFKFKDKYVKEKGKHKLNRAINYDSLSYGTNLRLPTGN